jgi:hypothetical protein
MFAIKFLLFALIVALAFANEEKKALRVSSMP